MGKDKRPLSVRIAEIGEHLVIRSDDYKWELEQETREVLKDMASKCNPESPCLLRIKEPKSDWKMYHLEAWEYITRKLNPHREWE